MSRFLPERFPGEDAIAMYASRYRRSDVGALEVRGPLDLFPSEPSPAYVSSALSWEHPWPLGERAGVYLIYSDLLDLLYIGKAQPLGARLSQHFGAGRACVPRENFWTKRPRFVINIAVPLDMPFEAPALEAYLIDALGPPYNVYGKCS